MVLQHYLFLFNAGFILFFVREFLTQLIDPSLLVWITSCISAIFFALIFDKAYNAVRFRVVFLINLLMLAAFVLLIT